MTSETNGSGDCDGDGDAEGGGPDLVYWATYVLAVGFIIAGLAVWVLLIQQGGIEFDLILLPPSLLTLLGVFLLLGLRRTPAEETTL